MGEQKMEMRRILGMISGGIVIVLMFMVASLVSANADCPPAGCSEANYGVSEAEIAAYPVPNVEPLPPNEVLLYDRTYMRVDASVPVNIYDAPNGSIIDRRDAGFNFVTVWHSEDGWAQINHNQWIPGNHLSAVNASHFTGVFLTEPLRYPLAWVLVSTQPSRSPGAEPLESDPLLQRYTRVNIFDVEEIDGWRWYQIGVDQWIHQTLVAKVEPEPVERPPEIDTHRWVGVDLYEQILVAYEGTTPVFATLISSGLPDFSTREGIFNVYVRYPRAKMSWLQGTANFYYLEEVPNIMYFDGSISLHGAYWHDGFGYRRSRGCVNLSLTDADWLYHWAAEEFEPIENSMHDVQTAVYVYSSGQYR